VIYFSYKLKLTVCYRNWSLKRTEFFSTAEQLQQYFVPFQSRVIIKYWKLNQFFCEEFKKQNFSKISIKIAGLVR